MINEIKTGPQALADGSTATARGERQGGTVVADGHGRYTELSRRGSLFIATATVTSPVIFSTAAGTGGPLLWNGTSTTMGSLLAISYGITTASAATGLLGFTGGVSVQPTSTTAIDGRTNALIGGPASAITPYRIGTVATAGAFFVPLTDITTTAVTAIIPPMFNWQWLDGAISIPPNGGWVSPSASATLTTAVMQIAVLWEEYPA